mmetsp:Transcript_20526/g.41265  ORF Transcript_20526/g.41265 Transcript_20526/m.41265 type:complete len:140 (-) Transcript_20526:226-645(-)
MASSSSSSKDLASPSTSSCSSKGYENVVKGGLKLKGGESSLKEVGIKAGGKKRKSKHQEELDQLKEFARLQEEEEQSLIKSATRGPTSAEKSFKLAREKRQKSRTAEQIQYTHRQKMDMFNKYLGGLSEHYDIPKVGPG